VFIISWNTINSALYFTLSFSSGAFFLVAKLTEAQRIGECLARRVSRLRTNRHLLMINRNYLLYRVG